MAEKQEPVFACNVSDFEGRTYKKRVKVEDRDIFIIKAKERFYALDSFCYHAGGPLHKGDIEELGDRLCMVCPWHNYKVCVDTGQNYFQLVDPHDLDKPPKWTAGEPMQRTHSVTVDEGKIYVHLSPQDGSRQSDRHNMNRNRSPE